MHRHIAMLSLAAVGMLLQYGCAFSQNEEAMYPLSSRLIKLTESAEALERYTQPSRSLSDQEFLVQAVEHDPQLLAPFDEYLIKVQRDGHNVNLLVCTQDGRTALLEDLGCTPRVDIHRWQMGNESCTFSMNVEADCTQ